MKPIILDRNRLEQYSTCPEQAYLATLFDALKAEANGLEIFDWEKKRLGEADANLLLKMKPLAKLSNNSKLADSGIQIHELIKRAFEACKNDLEKIPEWFVENLPSIRPDIQPMAIEHARHVADIIADYHINLLAVEQQISLIIYPETKTRPAIIGTMRYDLIGSGIDNLHISDWKTGFKRWTNTETQESFQARFGVWLLWNQAEYRDINIIHFWYYETLWGTKAYACFNRNEEHPRLPGLTTFAAITGQVKETVRMFIEDSRECWPTPKKCAWCDMIYWCDAADINSKELANDSKLFIDNIVVLEQLLKKRKQIATDWIKAKGPLRGSKVMWTRKKPSQPKFTTEFREIENET